MSEYVQAYEPTEAQLLQGGDMLSVDETLDLLSELSDEGLTEAQEELAVISSIEAQLGVRF